MSQTVVGLNDAKAVKIWSAKLAQDSFAKSYFEQSLVGVGNESSMPIQRFTDLEKSKGEEIKYDLVAKLKGQGVEGDNKLAGNEENLAFHTDSLYIDQKRHGVNTGGAMTKQRTLHDMRAIATRLLSDWWAQVFDEQYFIYLSGARGANAGLLTPLDFTGRANNTVTAPDSDHLVYGGNTTAKNDLDANDKITLALIDKLVTKANTMGASNDGLSRIQPVMVEGKKRFVLLMHDYQEYDLRTNTSTGQWLDIQKALASGGKESNIFKGGLGMYNDVVLHKHPTAITFTDYGVGTNVAAARALFLGEQAASMAFGGGSKGNSRYSWHEELEDRGNVLVVDTAAIFGVKKVRFNSKDFGVIAVDTAAAAP